MILNKPFLIVFLVLMAFSVSAAITDYNVVSPIPLDQTLTASGSVSPALNNVVCSFYVVDSAGQFMYRLTDEKTNEKGFFSTSYYRVSEPLLKRGFDYNLTVNCGADSASRVFTVDQREGFAHLAKEEIRFVTQGSNWDAFLILGCIVLFVGSGLLLMFFSAKAGRRLFG